MITDNSCKLKNILIFNKQKERDKIDNVFMYIKMINMKGVSIE